MNSSQITGCTIVLHVGWGNGLRISEYYNVILHFKSLKRKALNIIHQMVILSIPTHITNKFYGDDNTSSRDWLRANFNPLKTIWFGYTVDSRYKLLGTRETCLLFNETLLISGLQKQYNTEEIWNQGPPKWYHTESLISVLVITRVLYRRCISQRPGTSHERV